MKSLIIYYSRTGNTARIAHRLFEALGEKGKAEIFQLQYSGREKSLMSKLLSWVIPARLELGDVPFDIKDYDTLCIGIPVWGGHPAPPVSAYIKECKNTDGKKIVCLLIYGVESSAERCLNYIKEILDKKGRSEIIAMDIHWHKVHDGEFVDKLIKDTVDRLFPT